MNQARGVDVCTLIDSTGYNTYLLVGSFVLRCISTREYIPNHKLAVGPSATRFVIGVELLQMIPGYAQGLDPTY